MSDELGILLAADRLPTPKNLPIRNLDHVNTPDPENDPADFDDEELVVVLSVTSEGDRALALFDVGVGDEDAGGGCAEPVTMG